MTATGRYPPQPKFKPISFYSSVRLGNPEQLTKIMATDPYFVTQDNGAGAPLHFATTYKQLDMVKPRFHVFFILFALVLTQLLAPTGKFGY